MKKTILYLLICISTIGFAQEKPMVKAIIDTTNIRVGEQFMYTISVEDTVNVIIPKLENLKGLEVIEDKKIDTLKDRLLKKYILTGFDSGAFYIPQQQIFIKNKLHLTDSLLINVATVAIDTTKQPVFPIKAIQSEPYVFDDVIPYLWWIVLGLILIGVVLFFIFRKKKEVEEKEIVPLLPPYEEAIQKLQELDSKLLWQNNQIKQYYSELTDIVRAYIERELSISAMELTTNQLMSSLFDFNSAETIMSSKETLDKLKSLLQEADLVKFAKSKPLAEEIENDRKVAEYVLNNLKLKPIIEIEENDELE